MWVDDVRSPDYRDRLEKIRSDIPDGIRPS